ncbi:hypothetical protein N7481_002676 [Penicillium waksmanii]|uniref:uncharacterized protein n=1 Tax=Penicillium waksmanii TaxID=69791 RepID=UPI00254756AB|nr:uncharacterized protein N7481_002676 [Penicillium waksmanii]KAJ5995699.1 hypothetical protein N7481_002676 [Penicillium waksmanii]
MSPQAPQDDRSSEAGPGCLACRYAQRALVALCDNIWALERLCDFEGYHPTMFPGAKATPDPRKTHPNLTLRISDWRTAARQPCRLQTYCDRVRLGDFPLLDIFLIGKVPELHIKDIAGWLEWEQEFDFKSLENL